eukprot:1565870-Amphidinium_carterae.1
MPPWMSQLALRVPPRGRRLQPESTSLRGEENPATLDAVYDADIAWRGYMLACLACAYSQRRVRNTRLQCLGIGHHRAGLDRQRRQLEVQQGLHPQGKPPFSNWQIVPASQEELASWINPVALDELQNQIRLLLAAWTRSFARRKRKEKEMPPSKCH